MKKSFLLTWALVLVPLFLSGTSFASEHKELPAFTKDDRVLIMAPHPDDETIGAGGVIQRALSCGAKVKVVCLTNGDNNELAFIVYEKRLTLKKREFLHMGEVRRKETLDAMKFFGLTDEDVIFLGYPDFGTMEILTKYWETARPYKSMLTRVTRVAYPEAMSVGAPYVGESIEADLREILFRFRPTKIFLSHPADVNRDHRAAYLFLRVALWDVGAALSQAGLYPYLIHAKGWPKPRGYHPELATEPPAPLREMDWQKFLLSGEELMKKHEAILLYKSQVKYSPSYLVSFARTDELFSDYPPIVLREKNNEDVKLQKLNDAENFACWGEEEEEGRKEQVTLLNYGYQNGDLRIRLTLHRALDKNFGITIFLLGYRSDTDFSRMPKISIALGLKGMRVKDKKEIVFLEGIKRQSKGNVLILSIPLKSIGDPQKILASVRANTATCSIDTTAWRVIEFKK